MYPDKAPQSVPAFIPTQVSTSEPAHPSLVTRFVGRQPVLDSAGRTFGYELLYRAGWENRAEFMDGNVASATVIDAALTVGLDSLCSGKRAFVNCTEELLISRDVVLLPVQSAILEILESVPATPEVIQACCELKEAGYMIALDDYVDSAERAVLLQFADVIKLEPQCAVPEVVRSLRGRCGRGVRFLAEKVETWEQVRSMADAGCDLFQGYFFARPKIIGIREVRPFSASYLRIMRLLSAEHFDFAQVAEALKTEPSLCYRLLRYLNSCRFAFRGTIQSLSHALALTGELNFRRWLAVATLAIAGAHACNELLQTALIRARFCELLAPTVGCREEDLFLTGLLSLFNVVLDVPTEQLVAELAVSAEVRSGLLGSTTMIGGCRELASAYCSGDWSAVVAIASFAGIDTALLPDIYLKTLAWARDLGV